MLDLDFVRENTEKIKTALGNRGDKIDIDTLLDFDEQRRKLIHESEQLRSQLNTASKKVAELKKAKKNADELIAQNRELADKIKQFETERASLDSRIKDILLYIPNVPADDVPVGRTENDNSPVKSWGKPREFAFKPLAHWDIARIHGLVDFDRAAKISGNNFALYIGDGARLERALINFMLELHQTKHGYTEVLPPFLVNRKAMIGTGQLPKFEEDAYRCEVTDQFLIPTAEVPVTNIHADEIIPGEELPIRYTAYSGCFRLEAGSYGKETRGLLRVHQFNKVELVKFVRPETSCDEHETLLADAEEVLQLLGLPYRVVTLCTGEMGFTAAKCYDIEVWAPGVERWLEVSSCSNFQDFQARRANIRFKDKGSKPQFVHTLNGSGTALPRVVIALLEHYQNEDGTVSIPEPLRPFMRGQKVLGGQG